MILPMSRIPGMNDSQNRATMKHKTFEVPYHSQFVGTRSQEYHKRLNPTQSRKNAVTYPQTGLGG